jgi:ABC-2 type transport system permease protein
MRNVWTIAKREFNMYFASPVAYAILFGELLILGLFFAIDFGLASAFGGAPSASRTFGVFVTLMLFFTPALTMRLMAEEQRTGTIELLLTAPLREWELVTGKWLAAFGFGALLIAATAIYVFILHRFTVPGLDLGAIAATYVGLALLVAAMLAMGVFVSTLFSNQIAAFFAIIALVLFAWVIDYGVSNSAGPLADFLGYLSISSNFYDSFYNGAVELTSIVYYLSVVVLFLFLATRSVESRRWR